MLVANSIQSGILPYAYRTRTLIRKGKYGCMLVYIDSRLLVTCLASALVAIVLFIAAMATTDWVRLRYPNGLHRSSSPSTYVERQVSGLFRICRIECDNSSVPVTRSQSIFVSHF